MTGLASFVVVTKLYDSGPGHRTAAVTVPISGDWQLALTVRTSAIDEGTEYVDMPIRS